MVDPLPFYAEQHCCSSFSLDEGAAALGESGLPITATIGGLASDLTINLAWHWIDRYRRRWEK